MFKSMVAGMAVCIALLLTGCQPAEGEEEHVIELSRPVDAPVEWESAVDPQMQIAPEEPSAVCRGRCVGNLCYCSGDAQCCRYACTIRCFQEP